jgi:uncharacterized membrane protein YkvA (DUF1232 family)
METVELVSASLLLAFVLYAIAVLALVAGGRRSDAVAWARFLPDFAVLVRRLLADPRVSRPRKALLGGLVAYLALPFDLVPDFVPVAGQLDDAILLALVLRAVLRAGGPQLLEEHWPGPDRSLVVVRRLAFGR